MPRKILQLGQDLANTILPNKPEDVPRAVHEGPKPFVALKVLCHEVSTKPRAMMRIYYHIPWTNTDRENASVRAGQATTCRPDELRAYQILSNRPRVSKFIPCLLEFGESQQQ